MTWGSSTDTWGGNTAGWGTEDPVYYGEWTSPGIDLSAVKTVDTSVVSWTSTEPVSTSIEIYSSIDEGETWRRVLNGFTIPQVERGMDVQGVVLYLQARLESTVVNTTPELHTLTVDVQPGNVIELVPLITAGISSVEVSDAREGMNISMAGSDRSREIQRNRLLENYVVPVGTNYTQAIQDLIAAKRPSTTFSFEATAYVTPELVFGSSGDQAGGDPWKYAREMAQSIGMEVFFDVMGVCILRKVPDPQPIDKVATYEEGPQSMLLYVNKRIDDEETRNAILVSGESTSNSAPIRGYAEDNDPNSPFYVNGPFGKVPGFFQSGYVRTQAQADELAAAILRQRLGNTETARIISTVNPALEPGDLILVKRSASKVNAHYVIDKLTIPLGAQEPLNIGIRERGAEGA